MFLIVRLGARVVEAPPPRRHGLQANLVRRRLIAGWPALHWIGNVVSRLLAQGLGPVLRRHAKKARAPRTAGSPGVEDEDEDDADSQHAYDTGQKVAPFPVEGEIEAA